MNTVITIFTLSIILIAQRSSSDEVDDLLSTTRSRWCSSNQSLDKTCVKSIIKGYFSLYDLCAGNFSNCDLCRAPHEYIEAKIPLSKDQYSVKELSDVWVAVSMSVLERRFACSAANNGTVDDYLNEALKNDEINHGAEDWINHVYDEALSYLKTSSFKKCLTFKSLVAMSGFSPQQNTTSSVKPILGLLVLHQSAGYLVSRDCGLLPPPQLLLNDLYQFMGLQSTEDLIMEPNLKRLLDGLKVGGSNSSTDAESGHNHRKKRSIRFPKDNQNDIALQSRSKRSAVPTKSCISLGGIFTIFNYNKTAGLTLSQLNNIGPILLQQSTSGSCIVPKKHLPKSSTTAEKYGWGTLSVLIICLCSIFGMVLVPLGSKTYFQLFIVFFVALGIGTLVGDAILHLLPEVIGVHVHDPNVIWRLIGVLITLLAMFVLENAISFYKKAKKSLEAPSYGAHSHMYNLETVSSTTLEKNSNEICQEMETENKFTSEVQILGPKAPLSAAIMVILGDSIHNFADGLALGAAFTFSPQKGLSTSIAIFCHELPHEFGDFAILLAAGFKWKFALLANLLSSLTAFIGLYAGIAISNESPLAQRIIFAVTAGMFLYVALTDMLPSLNQLSETSSMTTFSLEIAGMALGMTIMALLSFYEESINIH